MLKMIQELASGSLVAATIVALAISTLVVPIDSEINSNQQATTTANTARGPIFYEADAAKRELKSQGSHKARERLARELETIYKSDNYKAGLFSVELQDNNPFEWRVKLFFPNPKTDIHWELQRLEYKGKGDHVLLHMSYNDNYPDEPPFVRIVRPDLFCISVTSGDGGAVRLPELTRKYWNSSTTSESLIMLISKELSKDDTTIDFCKSSLELIDETYTEQKARKHFRTYEADQ